MQDEAVPPQTPELAKWIPWLQHHFIINKNCLLKPFVLSFMVFVGCFCFWLGSYLKQNLINEKDERIASITAQKDERIAFLSDQLKSYKDRLNGASPERAAGEMKAMRDTIEKQQKQLNILFPAVSRQLTDQVKESLKSKIERLKKDVKFLTLYYSNLGDSPFYGAGFVQFFNENHINSVEAIQTSCLVNQQGIIVGLLDPDKPSAEATDFLNVLNESGLKASTTKWYGITPGITPPQDFDLFICP